jgi:polyferredoxin
VSAVERGRRRWHWYLLLILPFVGTLWVPIYNAVEPRALGIPFFYWYQFLWILISAALTAVVYFATRENGP